MTEQMKPSGIAWIGNIPQSWKTSRLKYNITCLDERRIPVDAALRNPGPYAYWGAGSIVDYVDNYIFDEELVLLGEDGAPFFDEYRPVAFLITEKIWANNHIHVIKGKPGVCNRFLVHYLNSVQYREYINGSVLNKLTQGNMNEIVCPIPSTAEQESIADFLDDKCAKIDGIIADIEKQIETLQKYKKSLITETVTKGLNKSAPMKDSGIEWIGEIPKHWSINKTRYLASLCSGATPSKDVYSYWEGDIPWVSSQEVKTDIIIDTNLHISQEAICSCSTKLMPAGTLVMVVRSGILQHTIPVALLGIPATINQDIKAFSFKPEMIPAYYKYYIQGENDALLNVLIKDKTTVESIDNNLLLSLRIMVPPIHEQKDIVSYLDERCSKINSILTNKQTQLEAIIQHKKSLIYEYVTGKKRVTEVN